MTPASPKRRSTEGLQSKTPKRSLDSVFSLRCPRAPILVDGRGYNQRKYSEFAAPRVRCLGDLDSWSGIARLTEQTAEIWLESWRRSCLSSRRRAAFLTSGRGL